MHKHIYTLLHQGQIKTLNYCKSPHDVLHRTTYLYNNTCKLIYKIPK